MMQVAYLISTHWKNIQCYTWCFTVLFLSTVEHQLSAIIVATRSVDNQFVQIIKQLKIYDEHKDNQRSTVYKWITNNVF